MKVLDIIPISKTKYRVFFDDEVAFVLYKSDIHAYGIKCGNEIEVEAFEEIRNEIVKRAKLRTLNLLKVKDYTETEIRNRLIKDGYFEEAVYSAVEYAKSYNYLGDEIYAGKYYDTFSYKKSLRQIEAELIRKGISKEIVNEVLSSKLSSDTEDFEIEQIEKYLVKKKYSDEMSYQDKMKIFAFLMRKGYAGDKIRSAMKGFDDNDFYLT